MRFESKLFSLAIIMTVLFAMALITGCGESDSAGGEGIAAGDTVSVMYIGSLDDGTVFDSSATGQPLKFVAGAGEMIPGFDMAVMGMTLNEKKTFTIQTRLPMDRAETRYSRKCRALSSPRTWLRKSG